MMVEHWIELDPLRLKFRAAVVDRFPSENRSDSSIPHSFATFVLPKGLELIPHSSLPEFYTLVLTGGQGERQYCAILKTFEPLAQNSYLDLYERLRKRYQRLRTEEMQELDVLPSEQDIDEVDPDAEIPVSNDVKLRHDDSDLPNALKTGDSKDESEDDYVMPPHLYSPKCLCILSRYPLYSTYKMMLTELYRLSIMPSSIPIERVISNFIHEVPAPPRGRVQVQFSVADATICVTRPATNQLPELDLRLEMLFLALNMQNVLKLLSLLMLENKILLVSRHIALLGIVSESIISLMFPFHWSHVFIPVLPEQFFEFTSAPVPFLMGLCVDDSFDPRRVPTEVVWVDLDHNTVHVPSDVKYIPLPEKPRSKLEKRLQEIIPPFIPNHPALDHVDLAIDIPLPPLDVDGFDENVATEFHEAEVREAFLRFHVSIFQKYRDFFSKKPEEMHGRIEPHDVFKIGAFVRSLSGDLARRFMEDFTDTQVFLKFIQDRIDRSIRRNEASLNQGIYDASSSDEFPMSARTRQVLGPAPKISDFEVHFFDESIAAKVNRSMFTLSKIETPLLNDQSWNVTKTYVAPSPDMSDLPKNTLYHYDSFPRLNPRLLVPPRPLKRLIDRTEVEEQDGVGSEVLASWKTVLTMLASMRRPEGLHEVQSKIRRSFIGDIDGHDEMSTLDIDSTGAVVDPNRSHASALQGSDHGDGIRRITFDTESVCPRCHWRLTDSDVRAGWSWTQNDYCTTCPSCNNRFVPRFQVFLRAAGESYAASIDRSRSMARISGHHSLQERKKKHDPIPSFSSIRQRIESGGSEPIEPIESTQASAAASSSSAGSFSSSFAITCEYLNPILLKKEVENLLRKEVSCDEALFREHPVIFWNMILTFQKIIPLPYLLPQVDWNSVVESLAGISLSASESVSSSRGHAPLETLPPQYPRELSATGSSSSDSGDIHDGKSEDSVVEDLPTSMTIVERSSSSQSSSSKNSDDVASKDKHASSLRQAALAQAASSAGVMMEMDIPDSEEDSTPSITPRFEISPPVSASSSPVPTPIPF